MKWAVIIITLGLLAGCGQEATPVVDYEWGESTVSTVEFIKPFYVTPNKKDISLSYGQRPGVNAIKLKVLTVSKTGFTFRATPGVPVTWWVIGERKPKQAESRTANEVSAK